MIIIHPPPQEQSSFGKWWTHKQMRMLHENHFTVQPYKLSIVLPSHPVPFCPTNPIVFTFCPRYCSPSTTTTCLFIHSSQFDVDVVGLTVAETCTERTLFMISASQYWSTVQILRASTSFTRHFNVYVSIRDTRCPLHTFILLHWHVKSHGGWCNVDDTTTISQTERDRMTSTLRCIWMGSNRVQPL